MFRQSFAVNWAWTTLKKVESSYCTYNTHSLTDTNLGLEKQNDSQIPVPICDRCHNLLHHHSGVPINHPSMRSIEATIAESPYKHNHIYHVLDAADFPMTLIPNLNRHLDFAKLRTRNRRSKSQHWTQGRTGDMSFIITRSDLLAPKKEQ